MARKDANPGQDLRIAQRREIVADLRLTGASIRAISRHLIAQGFDDASPATVHSDIKAMLSQSSKKQSLKIDQLRALENQRLDAALLAIYPKVVKGDVAAVYAMIALSQERRRWNPGVEAPLEVNQNGKSVLEIVYGEGGESPSAEG